MALLLDTHVLIWLQQQRISLPQQVIDKIYMEPEAYFSLASVWEMAIKLNLNKLNLSLPLPEFVTRLQSEYGFQVLRTKLQHVYLVQHLPLHHADPFDRLIIAQSLVEEIPVVSSDAAFDAYGVTRIWK